MIKNVNLSYKVSLAMSEMNGLTMIKNFSHSMESFAMLKVNGIEIMYCAASRICSNIFFNFCLADPRLISCHYRGDNLNHPILITVFLQFRSDNGDRVST